jgi:hypothetical protein
VFILEQQRQQEFADCPGATGNKNFHYGVCADWMGPS